MSGGHVPYRAELANEMHQLCTVTSFTERDLNQLQRAFVKVLEGHHGRVTTLLDDAAQQVMLPKLWRLFECTLQAAVSSFARQTSPILPSPLLAEPTGVQLDLPSFYFAKEVEKVAINAASTSDLADLPGLGMVSAAKLTSWRSSHGPFANREAVLAVPGISNAMVDKFDYRIHYEITQDLSATLNFLDVSSFTELLDRCEYHRLRAPGRALASTTSNYFISRTKLAVEWILYFVSQLTPSSLIERRQGIDLDWVSMVAAGDALRQQASFTADQHCARVYGSRYLYALLDVVASAQASIAIQMFFFLSDPGSPGAQLIDALKAAMGRGVDVKIILDTDLEDDYHGALEVNHETFVALADAGIPFRKDWLGTTTHSKIVVVDGHYVLCGSHNLTAGSIYGREEISLFLYSASVAQDEEQHFAALWDMYDSDDPCIDLGLVKFLTGLEREALSKNGVADSMSLLLRAPVASSLVTLAREAEIDLARLKRLWRILRLMLRFRFAEADAYALTATRFDAPSEFASASLANVVLELEALPPLPAPYRYWAIRYDVIEAAHD